MNRSPEGFQIRVIPEDKDRILREIREGLIATPRKISPRFFYDDYGSELFERITELPEYYPTRTEESILRNVAADVIRVSGAEELIELGSGASTKTRVLLNAMRDQGRLKRYVPFDVSEGIVRRVATELMTEYPGLAVHAVIGDFTTELGAIPDGKNRLSAFLGGTIGNLRPPQAVVFLRELGGSLGAGDYLFLGTDLIKDVGRLEAAYNDSQGVTAEFNRNALRVLNQFLDGDFDPDGFEHHAFYNREECQIEMWLRSSRDQKVRLPGIDLEFPVSAGEEILTEISGKYDRERVESLLVESGFELSAFYTDPENLFALSLARRL